MKMITELDNNHCKRVSGHRTQQSFLSTQNPVLEQRRTTARSYQDPHRRPQGYIPPTYRNGRLHGVDSMPRIRFQSHTNEGDKNGVVGFYLSVWLRNTNEETGVPLPRHRPERRGLAGCRTGHSMAMAVSMLALPAIAEI